MSFDHRVVLLAAAVFLVVLVVVPWAITWSGRRTGGPTGYEDPRETYP